LYVLLRSADSDYPFGISELYTLVKYQLDAIVSFTSYMRIATAGHFRTVKSPK
jgi:hypothetical protein